MSVSMNEQPPVRESRLLAVGNSRLSTVSESKFVTQPTELIQISAMPPSTTPLSC